MQSQILLHAGLVLQQVDCKQAEQGWHESNHVGVKPPPVDT
jgi:hydrogenase maturation factor